MHNLIAFNIGNFVVYKNRTKSIKNIWYNKHIAILLSVRWDKQNFLITQGETMPNFNVNTFVENQPDNSVDFEADTCLECHSCGAEYDEDVIEETPTCSDCGQELNI